MAELLRKQTGDLITLESPQLGMFPHLRHAYFTRHGGVSQGVYESMNFRFTGTDPKETVMENYRIAAAYLGGNCDQLARTTQKHTDCIEIVGELEGFTSVGDGVAMCFATSASRRAARWKAMHRCLKSRIGHTAQASISR